MKLFLLIIFGSLLIGSVAYAATSVYYDFSNGQPSATDSATDGITPYFDFTNGQPTILEQIYTAPAATGATPNVQILIWEE